MQTLDRYSLPNLNYQSLLENKQKEKFEKEKKIQAIRLLKRSHTSNEPKQSEIEINKQYNNEDLDDILCECGNCPFCKTFQSHMYNNFIDQTILTMSPRNETFDEI